MSIVCCLVPCCCYLHHGPRHPDIFLTVLSSAFVGTKFHTTKCCLSALGLDYLTPILDPNSHLKHDSGQNWENRWNVSRDGKATNMGNRHTDHSSEPSLSLCRVGWPPWFRWKVVLNKSFSNINIDRLARKSGLRKIRVGTVVVDEA